MSRNMPDGKIMHAALRIGDSMLMLNDEMPEHGALSPLSHNGTGVTIHIYTENVDAAFNRAVSAGAKVKMPLMDQFWGDRYGIVTDPFGHQWSLATHVKDVSPEEMQRAQDGRWRQDANSSIWEKRLSTRAGFSDRANYCPWARS